MLSSCPARRGNVLAIIVGFDCGVTKPRDAGLRILNSQARGTNKQAGREARLFEVN
jgi:hypothetical protein